MLHMEAVALLTILVKVLHITQVRAQAKVQTVTLIRVQTNQIPIAIQINQAVLQNQVLSQNSLMQSMTQM